MGKSQYTYDEKLALVREYRERRKEERLSTQEFAEEKGLVKSSFCDWMYKRRIGMEEEAGEGGAQAFVRIGPAKSSSLSIGWFGAVISCQAEDLVPVLKAIRESSGLH